MYFKACAKHHDMRLLLHGDVREHLPVKVKLVEMLVWYAGKFCLVPTLFKDYLQYVT